MVTLTKFPLKALVYLFFVFFSSSNFAATFTSVTTGEWDDGATWGNTSPGVSGTDYPGSSDVAIISAADNVYLDGTHDEYCSTLTISGALSTGSPYQVYIGTGGVTINSTGTLDGGSIDGLVNSGNLTLNSCLITDVNFFISMVGTNTTISGTGTVNGLLMDVDVTNNATLTTNDISGNATTSTFIQGANATLNYKGLGFGVKLDASASGNTVNYAKSTAQNIRTAVSSYYNLTCSGNQAKTLAANIDINGTLTIAGGATCAFDVKSGSNFQLI